MLYSFIVTKFYINGQAINIKCGIWTILLCGTTSMMPLNLKKIISTLVIAMIALKPIKERGADIHIQGDLKRGL